MPGIIVFLGPSLPRSQAEAILTATYLPPVARGDVLRAVETGAKTVCIIDGVFHQESAVGHREILDALRRGVSVVGASSMGALRAAEMDTLGMVGIGEVYRMYREGLLDSDDEVALVFDPVTGDALSEPLVNIRATLRSAQEKGVIDATAHTVLLAAARSLYYPERTYPRICEQTREELPTTVCRGFLEFVTTGAVDIKRNDACEALVYIRDRMLRS
ncbi:MAG: TfuA-related McrA-glycine thioamidation protein [Methanomicrobiales archaeon]|nr:TfuA-related McrA-glycine thioamidation protein [Methanomicrobiales archaeon]